MFYKVYTGETSFPEAAAQTGTFSTSGTTITFNGTKEQLFGGDYIYSTALNEVRKITNFTSSSPGQIVGTIESAFSADVEVEEVKISKPIYSKILITNFGGADGKLNSYDFPVQSTLTISEPIAITIDGTGTKISIYASID